MVKCLNFAHQQIRSNYVEEPYLRPYLLIYLLSIDIDCNCWTLSAIAWQFFNQMFFETDQIYNLILPQYILHSSKLCEEWQRVFIQIKQLLPDVIFEAGHFLYLLLKINDQIKKWSVVSAERMNSSAFCYYYFPGNYYGLLTIDISFE